MVYQDPPWVFKGRALYQLQLVKSEEARKYIPSSFKLVEMFGYTLGGFYLARYEDSPAGTFNELVALAGLVWNPPTSCAWAARVYVDNKEARDHGLKSVGLPSRLAQFSEISHSDVGTSAGSSSGSSNAKASWWQQHVLTKQDTSSRPQGLPVQISNRERNKQRKLDVPVCTLLLPAAREPGAFAGPRINLALPSFSGATLEYPALLKYACDLATNVRVVQPAAVRVHRPVPSSDAGSGGDGGDELMSAVLGGKPLVCLAFDNMEMTVQEPERLVLPAADQQQSQAATSKAPWRLFA